MFPNHILSSQQFLDTSLLEKIFKLATELEEQDKRQVLPQPLKDKIVSTLFYEPSTRSRLSFESAIQKLGGKVISTENARQALSAYKGESLEDTIQIVNGYAQAIVLRYHEEGGAKRAAAVSSVPIINAGDGAGEHPTQALYDVYTIQKELGHIDNVSIAMVGDLLYGRTVHSLLPLVALYKNVTIYLVAPDSLGLPAEQKNELAKNGTQLQELNNINGILPEIDVLYMTRVQKERFASEAEYEKLKSAFVIDKNSLAKMKKEAIIMHPLPRITEINPEIDTDPRAAYFREARNGLYVRMALLHTLFTR